MGLKQVHPEYCEQHSNKLMDGTDNSRVFVTYHVTTDNSRGGGRGCFCLFLVIIFLITLSFPLVAMMRWLGLTFLQSYTLFCRKRAKKRFIMLAIHRAPPWVSSKKVRFVYSGEMWPYMSTAKPGITDFSQSWLLQGHEILISPCLPSCPTTCKYQLREYAGPFEIDT